MAATGLRGLSGRSALRLRGRRTALLRGLAVALLAAVLGFAVVGTPGRSQPTTTALQNQDEGDLARILASLTNEADALREELGTLKLQLLRLQTSSQQDEAGRAAAAQQLADLQVLAGTVPVTGPGVVVTVDDPARRTSYDVLLDLVEELRDAGAEAISVDDRRVGATSWFGQRDGSITLDGAPLAGTGITVRAIGQASTMEGGVAIPGGAVDTLQAEEGVDVRVARSASLRLPALAK